MNTYVAPTGTPLEDMVQPANDITHALTDVGLSAGLGEAALDEFLNHWREAAEVLTSSPAEELKWRLNTQLQGEDPGQPVNWRGPQ